ncbi:PAN domain-containing protein [Methylosinus sp. Sm6]|uniref:PAN domain-containing protein n=1 Tax=Methylosinus sp. Sm6 TaxID=2866948 RepID=UPI001C993107|nr:PAN domain-containing protein [Methylosinus sp. Sm6]MBY6242935.1 hypothetical protein [Methylosinus sp. Sm6]
MMAAVDGSARRPMQEAADSRPWSEVEAQYREECAALLRDARRHLEQRVASEQVKIDNALAAFARDFDAWLERERRGEASPKPSLSTLFEIWLERGAAGQGSSVERTKRRAAEAEAAALRERLDAETARADALERRLREAAPTQAAASAPTRERRSPRAALVVAIVLAGLGAIVAATAVAPSRDLAGIRDALEAEARHTLAELAARRAGTEALAALLAADKDGTIARVIAADPPAARARLNEIAPAPQLAADAPAERAPAAAESALPGEPAAPAAPPPAAAPEAPAPKPAAFRPSVDNRDVAGAQIAALRNLDALSCLAACRRRPDCLASVFDKWNRMCRLKSSVTAFRLNPRATSALREDVHVPRPPAGPIAMERYPSKAFPGEGYRSQPSEGADACKSLCRDDAACVAFTFRLDDGLCHLFSTTGEYFPNALADSGGKRQD